MDTTQNEEKQPKRGFLWRWIVFSGVGGAIGGILISIAGLFIFLYVIGDAPRPPDLPPMPTNITVRGGLIVGTMLGTAIGLPLGIVQWIILLWRFKNFRTLWWVPVYSFGLIFPISAIFATIESYNKMMLPVLLVAWFIAGIVIGGIQWLILRKLIAHGFWLIPLNLIALLGFVVCMAVGILLNQLIYCLGIVIGGFLGGSLYGAIIGLQINKTREQSMSMVDASAGGVQP
jgi:hypothetical protein